MAEDRDFEPLDHVAERAEAYCHVVQTLAALPPKHAALFEEGLDFLRALKEGIRPRENKTATVLPIRGGKSS